MSISLTQRTPAAPLIWPCDVAFYQIFSVIFSPTAEIFLESTLHPTSLQQECRQNQEDSRVPALAVAQEEAQTQAELLQAHLQRMRPRKPQLRRRRLQSKMKTT